MLTMVTGVPGARKTAFVVDKLDKLERSNKVNLLKNQSNYKDNSLLHEKYSDDFTYIEFDTGSGHKRKTVIQTLDDNFFDFLLEDFDSLRPDDYYKKATHYNDIIERIHERENERSFKPLYPVRTVYSNIEGLKIDFVRSLDVLFNDSNVFDWRLAPDGSVIVIDEFQILDPFCNVRDKNNPIIQDLTVHRHRGFDFYFITQAPSLAHPTVKDLVGLHFHLTVPYGMHTKVYQFGSTRAYPNTASNKRNCETTFQFKPADRIYKLYKSTTINTHKKRVPYKLLAFMTVFVIFFLSLFIYGITGIKSSTIVNDDPIIADVSESMNPYSVDNITSQYDSMPDVDNTEQKINEQKELQKKFVDPRIIELTEFERTTPVGVMRMGDKCLLVNNAGERINVSHDLCLEIASDPHLMPKSESHNNVNRPVSPLSLASTI